MPYSRPVDDDGYFGEAVAASYDGSDPEMFEPAAIEPAVDRLAALAGDGRALEFGIGTGRIALPLSPRSSDAQLSQRSSSIGETRRGRWKTCTAFSGLVDQTDRWALSWAPTRHGR